MSSKQSWKDWFVMYFGMWAKKFQSGFKGNIATRVTYPIIKVPRSVVNIIRLQNYLLRRRALNSRNWARHKISEIMAHNGTALLCTQKCSSSFLFLRYVIEFLQTLEQELELKMDRWTIFPITTIFFAFKTLGQQNYFLNYMWQRNMFNCGLFGENKNLLHICHIWNGKHNFVGNFYIYFFIFAGTGIAPMWKLFQTEGRD